MMEASTEQAMQTLHSHPPAPLSQMEQGLIPQCEGLRGLLLALCPTKRKKV